ncbi:MAG: alcohol dehydrogenase catalytic domain-containing protein, partial [Nitrospirae bacterium]|nr:alcohol dehydrogenase catalytic domain-containing protein [Nitrospirota bacterium]
MKAVLIMEFGLPEVLKLEDVAKPVISNNEVLIRVHYSSVNPVDWKIRNRSLKFIYGSKFPMALGFDVAGEVIKTGSSVTRFKKGDRVFGMPDYKRRGAYAEYVSTKEENIALIPE